MTLRQAIDTAISHNAIIILQEDEQNHYAHTVWKGVLHQLPKEYLDREFKPICDYVNYEKQYESPIVIELKSIEDRNIQSTVYLKKWEYQETKK